MDGLEIWEQDYKQGELMSQPNRELAIEEFLEDNKDNLELFYEYLLSSAPGSDSLVDKLLELALAMDTCSLDANEGVTLNYLDRILDYAQWQALLDYAKTQVEWHDYQGWIMEQWEPVEREYD